MLCHCRGQDFDVEFLLTSRGKRFPETALKHRLRYFEADFFQQFASLHSLTFTQKTFGKYDVQPYQFVRLIVGTPSGTNWSEQWHDQSFLGRPYTCSQVPT